jgi:hypothetical protein
MNLLDFLIRLKSVKKGGAGLPSREMRDSLMAEHLGPVMHAKLRQASRARKKRSL